jgi:hypothetical protein
MSRIELDFIEEHLGTETLTKALAEDIAKHTADGRETGMNWKDDYRPGGPIDFGPPKSYETREAVKVMLNHITKCHYAWLAGFDAAIKERGYIYKKP